MTTNHDQPSPLEEFQDYIVTVRGPAPAGYAALEWELHEDCPEFRFHEELTDIIKIERVAAFIEGELIAAYGGNLAGVTVTLPKVAA